MSEGQKQEKPKRKRSEKRVRKYRIELRLKKEEHDHLRRLAKIANVTPQTVIRVLLEGLTLKPAKMYPEEVYRSLVGIGRNVNQIARKVNSGETPSTRELEDYTELVREMLRCLYSK